MSHAVCLRLSIMCHPFVPSVKFWAPVEGSALLKVVHTLQRD